MRLDLSGGRTGGRGRLRHLDLRRPPDRKLRRRDAAATERQQPGEVQPDPCSVSYTTPADGRQHAISAEIEGSVRGLIEVDIAGLAQKLAKQSKELKMCTAGQYGLPGWSGKHGRIHYIPPSSWTPGDPLPMTGSGRTRGYVDDMGDVWKMEDPSAAVAGRFTEEWDVQFVNDSGRRAWDNRGWPRKDSGHANVTPDGLDSHGEQPKDREKIPTCDNR
jgi:hypothetical protein